MDASPLPVLVRWTDAAGPTDIGAPRLPVAMPRVDVAATTAEAAREHAAGIWPGRDLLVLHADTVLDSNAWRRLSAAWHDGDWDALSPLLAAPGDAAAADAAAWTRA